MSAEIIQFVPRPNPNRDKALIDQTNMEQMAVNVLHQALGYPDAQHASGIDGLWPEKDGA
jgi:hypothetical protein